MVATTNVVIPQTKAYDVPPTGLMTTVKEQTAIAATYANTRRTDHTEPSWPSVGIARSTDCSVIAIARMTPRPALSVAAVIGSTPSGPLDGPIPPNPRTKTNSADKVVASVSANKIQPARRRSIATAAATNATAKNERYRIKEMSVAPRSIVILPTTELESASAALFQIGLASPRPPEGSNWMRMTTTSRMATTASGRTSDDKNSASPE